MKRTDILDRKEDILLWISNNESKAYMSLQLNCKPETLNSYLKKMRIEYSGNKGSKGKQSNLYKTAEEYIKSPCVKSHKLKGKLLKDNVKEHICERCRKSSWLNKQIPLELHHKDGDRYNNELENLELLCPNCHALEPNNSGAANKLML